MALTLVVEDGTGKTTANSYATVANGTSYHEAHIAATAWTGSALQEEALVMATRLIDDGIIFDGIKVDDSQALEWPRFDIKDRSGYLIQSSTIPQALINATAELARWLIGADRTAETDDRGFKKMKVGSLELEIDHADRTPVLPKVVVSMLSPFGRPRSGSLARVTR